MRNAAHTLAHPALEREERETPLPALRGVQRGPTHPQSAHRCRLYFYNAEGEMQHRAGVISKITGAEHLLKHTRQITYFL